MIKDSNNFASLTDMVNHLSGLPGVIGIVEYGGRPHTHMHPGGDYDLTVIFGKPVSKNFSGVHFHVAGIPVDCMLLSAEDFMLPEPASPFHLVHLNCTILHDKNGAAGKLLEGIKSTWKKPQEVSESEKTWIRFATKHTLDKLEHRLLDDELYSRVFIAQTVDYIMEIYSQLKQLEPGKTKSHLAYMKLNDEVLYNNIENLLTTTDLKLQFELLKKINASIAQDVGGMWQAGEALFHINPDGTSDASEQEAFIKFLFGGAQ